MNKNDPSKPLAELALGIIGEVFKELRVAFPCKVLSYDEGTGMAVVSPLLQLAGLTPSPIQNVPAIGHKLKVKEHVQTIVDQGFERTVIVREHEQTCTPSLSPGDTVYVVCADRHMKTAQSGVLAKPDSRRMHNANDAVIVGVLPCSL
jgi:hypothetical protein